MQLQIIKFELYPKEEPVGYAVGFNVTTSNDRKFYRDTVVSLTETLVSTDEEIISMAWEQVKVDVEAEVTRLEAKSSLVGSVWTPPSVVEDILFPLEEVPIEPIIEEPIEEGTEVI